MVRPAVAPGDSGSGVEDDEAGVTIGTAPAAEADLGRSAPLAGAATPVFRKRYRIAKATDTSVCAKEDVQPAAKAKQGNPRDCPPAAR